MIKNKYIIETNEEGYVTRFYSVLEGEYNYYGQMALHQDACSGYTKFITDDSEAKGHFEIDEAKKAEIEAKEKEETEHQDKLSEQLNRIAEMCVSQGVNADDFLSKIDAQTIYTAVMTDTVIEAEEE